MLINSVNATAFRRLAYPLAGKPITSKVLSAPGRMGLRKA